MLRSALLSLLALSAALPAQDLQIRLRTALGDPAAAVLSLPALDPDTQGTLELRLRLDGTDRPVILDRTSIRAHDFSVAADLGAGNIQAVQTPPSRLWRGLLVDEPGSDVVASLTDEGLFAYLFRPGRDPLALQPANQVVPGAPADLHVVHAPRGMPADACGVVDGTVTPAGVAAPRTANAAISGNPYLAELAFDCDVELYQAKGSSIPAVVDHLERVMLIVNAFYERDVDITHRLTHILVRTAEPDPYSGNDAGTILGTQFRGEWNSNQTHIRRDIAHFVTNRVMGNILGLAYVGVVCTSSGYGLSRIDRGFDNDASVIGHEIGHNWSCPHCLDTCDVMCGCGAAGGFGPNDQAQIASHVATRTCIEQIVPEATAHWKLDEPAGAAVVADSGPNGLSGALVGGAQPGAAGVAGNAVAFDGLDDLVWINDGPGLTDRHRRFSFTAWIRPSRLSGWSRLFGKANQWAVGLSGDRLAFTVYNRVDLVSTATVPLNQWSHVAVSFDGAGTAVFHVDGVRVDARNTTFIPSRYGGAWVIGARGQGVESFAGTIDDVQIYADPLGDSDLAALFADPGHVLRPAGHESYGQGLAGSVGIVPVMGVVGTPLVGNTITLVGPNTTGTFYTQGFGLLGPSEASIPLLGGTLLVDNTTALGWVVPIGLNGFQVRVPLPLDPALFRATFHAQVLQLDAGLPQGVAMSQGVRIFIRG